MKVGRFRCIIPAFRVQQLTTCYTLFLYLCYINTNIWTDASFPEASVFYLQKHVQKNNNKKRKSVLPYILF